LEVIAACKIALISESKIFGRIIYQLIMVSYYPPLNNFLANSIEIGAHTLGIGISLKFTMGL
jgi:hypothetical protein